jgi:hypothetical protein
VDAALEPEGTQRKAVGVEVSGFRNMGATASGGQWVSAVARDGSAGWRTFLDFGRASAGAGAGAGVRLGGALGRRHPEARRGVRSSWFLVRLPAMVAAKDAERGSECRGHGHVKAPLESTTRLAVSRQCPVI